MSTKNVVVVGGSSGGAQTARALAKTLPASHKIILIDSANFGYWPPAALRAAVKPGAEDAVFQDLNEGFFKAGSGHQVKPLTKITEISENSITTAAGETIDFEYAVLATGADYGSPSRVVSTEKDEAKSELREIQQQVKDAKHILVVGGGPVGVEFAGEVIEHFGAGAKKVTLVSADQQLIGSKYSKGLHNKLLSQLTKGKASVLLDDSIELPADAAKTGTLSESQTFTTKKGTQVEDVDFVFLGYGLKPRSQLVSAIDAAAVDETNSVKVDPSTLRVQSSKLSRWFAVGDVSNAPGGKLTMQITGQAATVAANIAALIKAGDKTDSVKLKSFSPLNGIIVVPLGAKGGAAQLPFGSFGSWFTSFAKGKTLFVPMFAGFYKA